MKSKSELIAIPNARYNLIKRFFDFILSLSFIIILTPLFLVVKIDSKGPILFKQKRVGINKSHFNILKFRTMRVDAPQNTPTDNLKNANTWITRSGKFLRKSSLDELPQLFNILKGEMSLIGPRPALWNQFDLIEEREKLGANSIRPGLTGLAQITGRDELPVKEKAQLDGKYAREQSFNLDLYCFFKTILTVIRKDGIVEGANKEGEEI